MRSRRQTLRSSGIKQLPPPQRSLWQHFCGGGHSKSCWHVLPHIVGASFGQLPALVKLKFEGQQTPYSCLGSTRHLYIGGQLGLPGVLPHRNGLMESVICKGSPTGHTLKSDFALRQLGTGGHGGRAQFTSINSHIWPGPGQVMPRHGSLHSHLGQPLLESIYELRSDELDQLD